MTDTLIRAFAAEPWAMQADWLRAIWAIATRQSHPTEKTTEDWTGNYPRPVELGDSG